MTSESAVLETVIPADLPPDVPPVDQSTEGVTKKRGPRRGKDAKIVEGLTTLYTLAGALLAPRDPFTAAAILGGVDPISLNPMPGQDGVSARVGEVMAVLDLHPAAKERMFQLLQGSAYANLIIGHGMVVLAIAKYHGVRLPAPSLGRRQRKDTSQPATPQSEPRPELVDRSHIVAELNRQADATGQPRPTSQEVDAALAFMEQQAAIRRE